MNRQKLQTLASEWVRMAKNDIRKKVIDFIHEVDTTPRELAYHLAMSEGELQQIIEGNGEITITTFAKLLIATGNALEIKPIEETPMGDYENILDEREFERPLPRPNVFERPRPQEMHRPQFTRPTFTREREEDFVPPMPESLRKAMEERYGNPSQPRDEHGRFMSPRRKEAAPRSEVPTSPFASKSTDELVKIIKERLWDTEINLNTATKKDLVKFLDDKNKRMSEYKRMKALEEDPKVNEFKKRMKKTLDSNPHLRDWVKRFVGELEE